MQKRSFWMLLTAMVLLLCLLPTTVLAADGTITAGKPLQVSAQAGVECQYSYTFTAPKTATYVVWNDAWEGSVYIDIDDANGYYVAGNSERCQFAAEKGATYTINLQVWSYNESVTKATINLKEAVPVTSLSFRQATYTGFMGGEYNNVYIDGTVQPLDGLVNGTWTISNPDVAELLYSDDEDFYAAFTLKSPGTTTITFTNSNGVKASCTIVVKDLKTIAMGDSPRFTVAPGETEGFVFTAPADGYYYVDRDPGNALSYSEDLEILVEGDLYSEEWGDYGGRTAHVSRIDVGLKKGQKYSITIKNLGSTTVSGNLEIHKAVPATSMKILGDDVAAEGYYHYYSVEIGPDYAIPESITWTSSNSSVLKITEQWSEGCEVEAVGTGTAVLTAKTASGLKATFTVEVVKDEEFEYNGKDYPLTLNKANAIIIDEPGGWMYYGFTPSSSGYYYIQHDADEWAVAGVFEEFSDVAGTGFYGDKVGGFAVWLEAGKPYIVYSYFYDETSVGTYNIYVSRMASKTNGWHQQGDDWFYYKNGKLVTGWQKIDGKWYYFRQSLRMATGLAEIDGKWYYLNNEMKTGWQQIDGKWYFFGTDGIMQTGWIQVSGKWYYMNSSGVMQTGWQQIGGKWYYMNSSGAMQTGWVQVGGKWYYLNSDMKTGWVQDGGKWYYLNSSGVMQTGWVQVSGKWYYLKSDMKTGWQKIDGSWYYLKSEMKTGWQQIGGSWYYLGSNGIMRTGWQFIGNSWYYLGTNGIMVTGTHTIDGVTYTFNSSGAMVK